MVAVGVGCVFGFPVGDGLGLLFCGIVAVGVGEFGLGLRCHGVAVAVAGGVCPCGNVGVAVTGGCVGLRGVREGEGAGVGLRGVRDDVGLGVGRSPGGRLQCGGHGRGHHQQCGGSGGHGGCSPGPPCQR